MSEVPIQLVIAAFNDEQAADKIFDQMKQAKKDHLIGIKAVAVIRRDKNNKVHINEPGDMGAGKGAAIGAVIGGAIGLITGPGALLTGAIGAAFGGLAAKLHDAGFPNERLEQIGGALTPGTSAIVAVIEHKWVAELEQEFAAEGAKVVTEAITADIAQQLAAGRDVEYSVLATGDQMTAERMAVGQDQAEIGGVTVTQDTVAAVSAVATPQGITGQRMVADAEGVTLAAFEAVPIESATEGATKGATSADQPSAGSAPGATSPTSAPSASAQAPASPTSSVAQPAPQPATAPAPTTSTPSATTTQTPGTRESNATS
jgi:uncharacterized membrane protein